MISGLEGIFIGSKDAEKLAAFYRDVVGLAVTSESVMGKDQNAISFDLGQKIGLYIVDHSKVAGKNNSPDRILFNLEVDDIEEETKRLKKSRVKVVQDIYHVEAFGFIATFEDTDGNFFQLVKTRE
jgi:predicted enzyme related to lactoylglutathione lyase